MWTTHFKVEHSRRERVRFAAVEAWPGDPREGSCNSEIVEAQGSHRRKCQEVLDTEVWEEEPVEDKLTKLGLVVKRYKNIIAKVKFSYEMKITELQMKLQPTTPQEVWEQRDIDLKVTMDGISTTLENYGKILDESL